jgi:hypothetical protein
LVQSQLLRDLSEQSVLGLHDLWTCLPVTYPQGTQQKNVYYNKPQTLAELKANAQAETVVICVRELKSVPMVFLRLAQQCLDMWGEHL